MKSIMDIARAVVDVHLPNHDISRVARSAMHVMKELNIPLGINLQTKLLTIEQNYTIKLPDNALKVTKVGVAMSNGTIMVLGRNDFIRRTLPNIECVEIQEVGNIVPQVAFYNYHEGSPIYGYVEPSSPEGYYRHNTDTNRIELSTGSVIAPGEQLYVEYQVDFSESVLNLVPEYYEQAIILRTVYNTILVSNPGTAQVVLREFSSAWKRIARLQRPSLADMVAALSHSHLGAKI